VEALTKTVTDALAPKLTELEGKIAAKPAEPKKDDPKPEDAPAWAKPVLATIGELKEQVGKLNGDATAQVEDRRVRALVTATLTEKKLPGLLKNERVFERLVNAKPKDAEALMKIVDGEREYAKSIGVNVEKWGAEPDAEGAKDANGNPTGKFDEQAEIEKVKALPRGGI